MNSCFGEYEPWIKKTYRTNQHDTDARKKKKQERQARKRNR